MIVVVANIQAFLPIRMELFFMNLPNILTLSRIPFMVIVAALLHPWNGQPIPMGMDGCIYLIFISVLTDWMDGGWPANGTGF